MNLSIILILIIILANYNSADGIDNNNTTISDFDDAEEQEMELRIIKLKEINSKTQQISDKATMVRKIMRKAMQSIKFEVLQLKILSIDEDLNLNNSSFGGTGTDRMLDVLISMDEYNKTMDQVSELLSEVEDELQNARLALSSETADTAVYEVNDTVTRINSKMDTIINILFNYVINAKLDHY